MPKPDPTRLRRTATTAAIFDDRGRILLHCRSDNGRWALPGGAMEIGESAEESVRREVREETGYEIVVERLVGIYSIPSETTITYPNGDVVAYVSLLFAGRVVAGAATLNDESSAVEWFDPNALPEPIVESHRQRIQDAVATHPQAFYR